MQKTGHMKSCKNYKSVSTGEFSSPYRRDYAQTCKDCAYFSFRNCGMDAANSIEPDIEMFS